MVDFRAIVLSWILFVESFSCPNLPLYGLGVACKLCYFEVGLFFSCGMWKNCSLIVDLCSLQEFYEDLFQELNKYGEIESLNVCDNLADHMVILSSLPIV